MLLLPFLRHFSRFRSRFQLVLFFDILSLLQDTVSSRRHLLSLLTRRLSWKRTRTVIARVWLGSLRGGCRTRACKVQHFDAHREHFSSFSPLLSSLEVSQWGELQRTLWSSHSIGNLLVSSSAGSVGANYGVGYHHNG